MFLTIGFTGTRKGITHEQGVILEQMITGFMDIFNRDDVIHAVHGGCEGADSEFHELLCNGGGYGLAEGEPFELQDIHVFPSTVKRTDGRDNAELWELAVVLGFSLETVIHDSDAPLKRNKEIVDMSDVMLCCPSGKEIRRSGTWATTRYAKKVNKNSNSVIVIYPDGTVEQGGCDPWDGDMICEYALPTNTRIQLNERARNVKR